VFFGGELLCLTVAARLLSVMARRPPEEAAPRTPFSYMYIYAELLFNVEAAAAELGRTRRVPWRAINVDLAWALQIVHVMVVMYTGLFFHNLRIVWMQS